MTLNKLVEQLRIEAGLSRRRLCILADVSRTSYRRFVAGYERGLPVAHLERIVRVLGYEIDLHMIDRSS